MPALLRKYGVSGTVVFPVLSVSGATFASGVTFAASDLRVSKNEAAFSSATATPTHVEGGVWKWAYTATQATTKRLTIKVKDQTASRAFEPVVILVETYGNSAAQHPFNLGATGVTVSDKTGFTLASAAVVWTAAGRTLSSGANVWAAATRTLTSGSTVAGSVWASAARTLTSAGVVWSAAARTLTDKTGFALTTGQHDAIAGRAWAETTRTLTSGATVAGSVWANTARTLTSAGVAWTAAARTLTAWSFTVSVGAIAAGAKTGFALTTGQHDLIATAAWAATTRTLTSGDAVAGSVWAKTRTQLTGVPTATAAAGSQLMFLYMSARNKRVTTATGDKIHNGASGVIAKAPLSATSTVFTKNVYATATG